MHAVLKKNIPIKGALELTYRCNLRCKHCYGMMDSPLKEMDYNTIARILDEIKKAGCLWLLVTGGEPLIRRDFLKIYTYAKQQGFLVTIFTNATLITAELARLFAMYRPFMIEVSMYGFSKHTYELVTTGGGSFYDTLNGIGLLRAYNIPFRIKMPVLNINKNDLGKVKKFADSLRVDFRCDPIIHPRINGDMSPYKYAVSLKGIKIMDREYSNSQITTCGEAKINLLLQKKRYIYFSCGAGMNFFSINPYGQLKLCMLSGYPSYNILQNSFNKGWKRYFQGNNNIFLRSRYRYKSKNCTNCDMLVGCKICPGWWKDKRGKDIFMPNPYLCRIAGFTNNQ